MIGADPHLGRRWLITVVSTGIVHAYDTTQWPQQFRDGWPIYSTDTREEAEALIAAFSCRTIDGDGWMLRRFWGGSVRDVGELRAALARMHPYVRGAA